MNISGEAAVPAAPTEVFSALLDPVVLQECIPGCESLERQEENHYLATVRVGVGAVKGRFQATVTLADIVEPAAYTMTLEGKSPVGHARGSASVTLEPADAGTSLSWTGEAKVSGMIAAVGQRLLGAAANKMAREFFGALAARF